MGVLAQELEKVIPQLVNKNNLSHRTVNYSGLIGVIIESIKELKSKVEFLEEKSKY